jgi:hypothetical protein
VTLTGVVSSLATTPGAHHLRAANASQTEPARLLAVFVVDTADENALTTFDMKPGDNHE